MYNDSVSSKRDSISFRNFTAISVSKDRKRISKTGKQKERNDLQYPKQNDQLMSHIINADLFNDRRDYIIAKLRQKIEEFKAYDEKRKAYYRNIVKENEWLKEELRLSVDTDRIVKLEHTIMSLKGANKVLLLKLEEAGLTAEYTKEEIAEWRASVKEKRMEKKWRKALEENKLLRNTISELVCKLHNANKQSFIDEQIKLTGW